MGLVAKGQPTYHRSMSGVGAKAAEDSTQARMRTRTDVTKQGHTQKHHVYVHETYIYIYMYVHISIYIYIQIYIYYIWSTPSTTDHAR